MADWRSKAALQFNTEKTPVVASRGVVAANHPLASAAGAQIFAAGGNAIDAAIATLFALTVVEPMMVATFGGGGALVRLADGREVVIDGMCSAPMACGPTVYQPLGKVWPESQETVGQKNRTGWQAVATPGNLLAWCHAVEKYGRLSLSDIIQPAIHHAEAGFVITPYLAECIQSRMPDIVKDPGISAILYPKGRELKAGDRLVQGDYATTLRGIAKEGPGFLYGGELGRTIVAAMKKNDGFIDHVDLESYRVIEREPVRIDYRGYEISGVPPPMAGGAFVSEMLNILEGYDLAAMGYGSVEATHLLLESMKLAGIDRDVLVGDPAFVDVPTDRLISKEYAAQRRALIDRRRAKEFGPGMGSVESNNTTHLTVADGDGNIVVSTQTINALFGACVVAPGTGVNLNNYMYVFNPVPGYATSIAPGKRVTGNVGPTIVKRGGKPVYALGLPGGFKIPSIIGQTLVNLLDHGMGVQEAVEAPRVFAKGAVAELEPAFPAAVESGLKAMGHPIARIPAVGGCMGAIGFAPDGRMTASNCWRADGAPMGMGGGYARRGARFLIEPTAQPEAGRR